MRSASSEYYCDLRVQGGTDGSCDRATRGVDGESASEHAHAEVQMEAAADVNNLAKQVQQMSVASHPGQTDCSATSKQAAASVLREPKVLEQPQVVEGSESEGKKDIGVGAEENAKGGAELGVPSVDVGGESGDDIGDNGSEYTHSSAPMQRWDTEESVQILGDVIS